MSNSTNTMAPAPAPAAQAPAVQQENMSERSKRKEILWMNFEPVGQMDMFWEGTR